ncbi:MAG: 5'/3'-nucleotidase SurE [Bdellovibrionales bacterium CG10_big_fil_rev_8_21_14_0_10_45_34]|nr:MAG: 5'/3'-nucleotidase SurE [Bdellovibrionales bacterium CG10_big_fil_rev_8_21_14_0_10_45_34]
MRILLANDDGVSSPGILKWKEHLEKRGHEVWLVAPSQNRSTVGHSLTLHKPLRIQQIHERIYSVSGSPADCVYTATRYILKQEPDLILSGVNRGANLGHDVFYSGTVAAAREGALFGIKSMAVSLCFHFQAAETECYWQSAFTFADEGIDVLLKTDFDPQQTVFNLNVPNTPAEKIKGLRMARQGRREYTNSIDVRTDPRGHAYYWLGGSYQGFEAIENSDCQFVEDGFVSLTPLRLDTTHDEVLKQIKKSRPAY